MERPAREGKANKRYKGLSRAYGLSKAEAAQLRPVLPPAIGPRHTTIAEIKKAVRDAIADRK